MKSMKAALGTILCFAMLFAGIPHVGFAANGGSCATGSSAASGCCSVESHSKESCCCVASQSSPTVRSCCEQTARTPTARTQVPPSSDQVCSQTDDQQCPCSNQRCCCVQVSLPVLSHVLSGSPEHRSMKSLCSLMNDAIPSRSDAPGVPPPKCVSCV